MTNHRFLAALAGFAMVMVFSLSVHGEPLMYVPTGETNEIAVIDLATDRIVNRIGELENAHGLATSAGTEYLVAGSMLWRDPGQELAMSRPEAVTEAEHQAHHEQGAGSGHPQGTMSYVSIVHPGHGHVMRRVAVPGLTHHTAVSPDGRTAVAVHSTGDGISVIDLERMAVSGAVATGNAPNYAVFSGDGRHLYVSNAGDATVSDIDTRRWTVARTLKTGVEPEHLALSSDGATLFAVNVGDGSVSAIDLATGTARAAFPVGLRPHGVAVGPDGQWLYASAQGEDQLARINLSTGEVTRAHLGPAPYHVAYVSATGRLYVASRKAPLIWVVDPESLAVIATIDLGEGVAHQMVVRER